MKKIILLSLLIFTNCTSNPVVALFGRTKHHLSNKQSSIASNLILKKGESCAFGSYFGNLLYLYYGIGGSIDEARDKAGITKIAVIDRKSTSIFPFYYEECVIVYGE